MPINKLFELVDYKSLQNTHLKTQTSAYLYPYQFPANITPVVSVVIPAYNTAAFIAEALESVFAQTRNDFEAIVINDGSQDTERLERKLRPYLDRLVYLKQENHGPSAARNLGIRHARGKYIAFLDSDDSWMPEYLASQLRLFDDNPSLDAVYSDALHYGNPALAGKTYMQTCPSNGPVTLDSLIRQDCQLIASCTVARKQVVVDAGLFDESLRHCEDYDLWLRILYRGGRIAYQKKVLGRYRSRPGSLSQNSMKMRETLVAVFEKAARTMLLPGETRAILQKEIAQAQAYFDLESGRKFLNSGDYDRAKESLMKANHFFRRAKLKLAILGLQIAPRFTRLGVITWEKLTSQSRLKESSPNL